MSDACQLNVPVAKILQRFERPSRSSAGAEDPLSSYAPASALPSASSQTMVQRPADGSLSDSFSAGLRAAQRFNASKSAAPTVAAAVSLSTPQAKSANANASEAEEWAKFEEKLMASLFV